MKLRSAFRSLVSAAFAAGAMGCSTFEFLTNRCSDEQISINWPATITQNGTTTTRNLFNLVTPQNVDAGVFKSLRDSFISPTGEELQRQVVWTVPAFDINGGHIAFEHAAPLAVNVAEPIMNADQTGGFGASTSSLRNPGGTISVRAANFIATSANGSVTNITGFPTVLRIDVTTQDAAGQTVRVKGDASFTYQKTAASCS